MENVFGDHEDGDNDVDGLQNKEVEDKMELPAPLPPVSLPLAFPIRPSEPGLAQGASATPGGIPVPLLIALGLGALGVLAWALTLPKKRNSDIDDLGEDDDEDDDDFDDDEEPEGFYDDSDEEDEESESESDDEDDEEDEEGQDEEELPDEGEDDEGE